ncbi:hypothetical protein CEXT_581961 [Caerostris extrusa]|uniref:Uncharacterized protein n=1 Tax=Caerostris extrusa TaxID=172846 RepID=A0AAV4MF35_CAEEX|nr:hypothetical protein CEXT_581961 [Caerostris extrusa]
MHPSFLWHLISLIRILEGGRKSIRFWSRVMNSATFLRHPITWAAIPTANPTPDLLSVKTHCCYVNDSSLLKLLTFNVSGFPQTTREKFFNSASFVLLAIQFIPCHRYFLAKLFFL